MYIDRIICGYRIHVSKTGALWDGKALVAQW